MRLEAWTSADFQLLQALHGDPGVMNHLGGAESDEKIAERLERFIRMAPEAGRMFKVVDCDSGEGMGSVGYWRREWRGADVWETGWFVLPRFQGRGVAAAATSEALARARHEDRYRYVHAFPGVDNAPSNAICRKLGFELVEEDIEFEYPKGSFMRCNDWRFDLSA